MSFSAIEILYYFALGSLIFWPWVLFDSLRRPESHWDQAGQNRFGWIAVIIFLGSVGGIIYLLVARPELEKIKRRPKSEALVSSGGDRRIPAPITLPGA